MRAGISDVAGNRLLAGLPEQERALVLPICEAVRLRLGDVISQAGEPIQSLYFPITAAISILDVYNADIVEITVIEKEGCDGSSVVGGEYSRSMSMVETDGRALRAPASAMVDLLSRTPCLRAALGLHYRLVVRHADISLVCRGTHSPAQRLTRWLKLFSGRRGLYSFPFSSALVATKLGMPNQEAMSVLDNLQLRGMVNRAFDHLTITDPEALDQYVCECFALTIAATEQYLTGLRHVARDRNNCATGR